MGQKRVLAFRFSAMGDVALCVPVIAQFCVQFPDVEMIFVTRNHFKAMFPALPNLFIHPIEPKHRHKGLRGLYQLYKELRAFKPTHIADLHENVRTKVLKSLFAFSRLKIQTIDKDRKARKRLVLQKDLNPTKPIYEKYRDVFVKLGFNFLFQNQRFSPKRNLSVELFKLFPVLNDKIHNWVGVFPFAQHIQKIYPLDKMREVIKILSKDDVEIFVFGAGKLEKEWAEFFTEIGSNVHSVIDLVTLDVEMQLISNLDVLLSMDTAGMHMASIFGVSVVSVWGATHPAAGFLGVGQDINNVVQVDLSCRPCSIYGNKPCERKDLACMYQINPQTIADKVRLFYNKELGLA